MITDEQAKVLIAGIKKLEARVKELECENTNIRHANKHIVKAILKNLQFFNYSGEEIPDDIPITSSSSRSVDSLIDVESIKTPQSV